MQRSITRASFCNTHEAQQMNLIDCLNLLTHSSDSYSKIIYVKEATLWMNPELHQSRVFI